MDSSELREFRPPRVRYQTQSLDTTPDAEAHLFALWRSWDSLQKIAHLNHTTYSSRLSIWHFVQSQSNSLEQQHPVAHFLKKVGLFPLPSSVPTPPQQLTMLGVIEEALVVIPVLESLGIDYFIGGSVASGIWGELRYTQDLDLIADIQPHHLQDLVTAFSPRFYVSEIAIQEAIDRRQSFNLIDNNTGWKIDIFVLALDLFHQNQFQRRQILTVDEQNHTLWFSSAEDMILQKIIWYHLSQNQSEQQWRDILGILKLQNNRLDRIYLDHWAEVLNVSPDLKKALTESGYQVP